jgi:predicted KAP-like P-loop ATPase
MPGYGNSTNTNKSTVKILTDEVDVDPFLDFQLYGETIIKIIKGSEPNYTIGIFGEWGTGKTTLMRYIFNELNKKNDDNESIIPVWFNAWKYEREHHFAIIPLLKTIELALPNEKYKNLRDSLREAGLFGLRVSKNFISSMIGSYLGTVTGDIVKKGITDFTEKILPGLKEIDEIEKRTIYFEGQSKIENEIKNIRMKDPSLRIVVFVDDLDRCSPEKVIEVFESIKVFLGMDGFIYVLGISHNKISQLIK